MDLNLITRQIKWRLGFKSPIVSNIKITNICNLRCKMCSENIRTSEQKEITTEKWKSKIDELYKKGVRIIVFEGGEPTLRSDLNEIINYAKYKKIYTVVITNGVNDFSYITSDAIWVSIDGIKQEHESVRGFGIFDKIKSNLEKAKDKNLLILSMINQTNVSSVKEFVEEFKNYPIYFNWVYDYSSTAMGANSNESKLVSKEVLIKLKNEGYKIFNSYKTLKSVGEPKNNCSYWLLNTVDSGGNIFSSCMVNRFGDKCRCDSCDLSCYMELNNIYNLDYHTRKNWQELLGMDLTFGLEKYFN